MKRMADSEDFGFGPMQGAAQAYFGKVNGANVELGQSFRGLARCQLEMWGLASRRAQAYLELPGRMSRCRTMGELQQEQLRFAQQASQQYLESTQRFAEAWQAAFLAPFAAAMPRAVAKSEQAEAAKRDYIAIEDEPVQVEKVRTRIRPRPVKAGSRYAESRHVA